jgi:hypothetical protein
MPSTYEPIATFTTTTGSTTSYTFSSIPSTYTDLIVVATVKATSADSSLVLRFNGDSGSNYSYTQIWGDGSSAQSQRLSNQTIGYLSYNGFSTANFSATVIHCMNYSNTTTFKTYLDRGGFAAASTDAAVGLWRSTSAINSVTLFAGNFFATGCTFTLYGIKAA